jgi:hypothetical protein
MDLKPSMEEDPQWKMFVNMDNTTGTGRKEHRDRMVS